MLYWHKYNPWKDDVVYVPIESLAKCTYDSMRNLDRWTKEHGGKLDAYILPQPSGDHCIGVRYGREGSEYMSPHGIPKKVQELLDQVNLIRFVVKNRLELALGEMECIK